MTEPFTIMITVDSPGHPLDFYTYPFKLWGDVDQAMARAHEIAQDTPHAISYAVIGTHGMSRRMEI